MIVYHGHVSYRKHGYTAESREFEGRDEEAVAAEVRAFAEPIIAAPEADVIEAWHGPECGACHGAGVVYVTIRGRKPDRFSRGYGGNEFTCPMCHGKSPGERTYLVRDGSHL